VTRTEPGQIKILAVQPLAYHKFMVTTLGTARWCTPTRAKVFGFEAAVFVVRWFLAQTTN
jgi:hypothetical protein